MALTSKAFQEKVQHELDELVADTIVLKLHDGPPGPDYADNLVGGDGMPQEYTYSHGGTVVFEVPQGPREARWYVVSMFSGGQPIMLVNSEQRWRLLPGDRLTLTDIQRPTMKTATEQERENWEPFGMS